MLKKIKIVIDDAGQELTFHITQMPAYQREDWHYRAMHALLRSGADVPDGMSLSDMSKVGPEGLFSLFGGIDYHTAKQLFDEMFKYCQRILPEGGSMPVTPESLDAYVQDPATIVRLRFEAVKLNLVFQKGGSEKNLISPLLSTQDLN